MVFQNLQTFLRRESEYVTEISLDQRYLLASIFLYALALPMITTFSNTYLWRQSQDLTVLAIFNVGYYAGLPFGFFLNAIFLRKLSPQMLCGLGCILQGVVPIALVFMGAQAQTYAILLGLALGGAGGFYWGNRNLITSQISQGPQRFKYISLENVIQIICAVLAPLVVGWFLVLGERTGVYSVQAGYQFAALGGFALLLCSAFCIAGVQQSFPPVKKFFVGRVNRAWNIMRVLDFANGVVNGIEASVLFFALITFLDKENAIGSLLSLTAILAALGMYLLGKRAKHNDHAAILGLWSLVTLIGKIVFAVFYSVFGAVILQALEGLTKSYRWASMATVMYETLEYEKPDGKVDKRYAYLMDREFVLNFGRVSALIGVILIYGVAPNALVRYGLFGAILFQLIMIGLTWILTSRTAHTGLAEPSLARSDA